jgi:flagellar motor protein MotB
MVMSRLAWMPSCWVGLLMVLLAGCAENPMVLKGRISTLEQQQVTLNRQNQQLQDRATALDRDNQELSTLLAQSRQQTKVTEDQLNAMRDSLRSVTGQLAQIRADKEGSDKRVQAMTTAMQRNGGVTIGANNSLLQTLPATNVPGVLVRNDGNVIRIEVPSRLLFETGNARLLPGAANLICDVAAEIVRVYPDQIVGIEGYTDNDPVAGTQWQGNQELSVGRAMSVYDVLVNRTRLERRQLFTVGKGAMNPIMSNGSPEGKQRNQRVELVIYPERKS